MWVEVQVYFLCIVHSFIHSFIHSFFHSFIRSFIHSFIHSFIKFHSTCEQTVNICTTKDKNYYDNAEEKLKSRLQACLYSDCLRQESTILTSTRPVTVLYVCVCCIICSYVQVFNHYAIAHAYIAANTHALDSDQAC